MLERQNTLRIIKTGFLLIFSLPIVFSCTKSPGVETELTDKYTLVSNSSIILPFDSTQGFFNNSLSQLELNDGSTWLSILNKNNSTIYYYDSNSGELIRKVKLEIGDGPNGIGTSMVQLMHAEISQDSIFVYNGDNTKMFIINSHGEVFKVYKYMESDVFNNQGPFYFSATNDNRPYIINDRVYMNCSYLPNDYKGKKPLFSLDLESGKFFLEAEPSQEYLDHCWGIAYSLNTFSAYDYSKKRFVLSFGVDPFVYSWKDGLLESKKFFGSKFFKNTPYSDNIEDYTSSASHLLRSEYSQLAPKYYKIVYLKESGTFLREAFLERTKDEKAMGITGLKKSIIIADSALNRVGEFRVPDGKYFTSNFFITDKGILLADMEYYNKNEDSIKFDLYEPKIIH